jgi:hypothetical protein
MAFIEKMLIILLDEQRVNDSLIIVTQSGNCTLNIISLEWVNVSVKAVVSTPQLQFVGFLRNIKTSCFSSIVAALGALYQKRRSLVLGLIANVNLPKRTHYFYYVYSFPYPHVTS